MDIGKNSKTLTLIRGLPRSGKTTLARALMKGSAMGVGHTLGLEPRKAHFENDFFFMKEGHYVYDPAKKDAAELWCLSCTEKAMIQSVNMVVVSNNFTMLWEMEPYIALAEQYKYNVQEIICKGTFLGNLKGDIGPTQYALMEKRFQYRPRRFIMGSGDQS